MDQSLRKVVEDVIAEAMDSVMNRVLDQDPFNMDRKRQETPLHTALVPEDIFKGSHFERRFVTSLGTVWEKLAAAVGRANYGFSATQHMIVGRVREGRLDRIRQTLDKLEHAGSDRDATRPDWATELAYVHEGAGPLARSERELRRVCGDIGGRERRLRS